MRCWPCSPATVRTPGFSRVARASCHFSICALRSAVVIDINRVTALEGIHQDNGRLILGALAGDRDIELSAAVRQQSPILTEAIRHVGHVEICHRGTVCGSLAHADPAAELLVVALALEAELLARSARGARTIAMNAGCVARAPRRLLTARRPTGPAIR
jgi:CO/xanthine dehydrogenase FAD-binding subunit